MQETLQSLSTPNPDKGRDTVRPDSRPAPQRNEQIARLQELAAVASTQERSQRQLQNASFDQSRYFTEGDDWITRIDIHDAGKIRYKTSFEMRRELVGAIEGAELTPALQTLRNDYLA